MNRKNFLKLTALTTVGVLVGNTVQAEPVVERVEYGIADLIETEFGSASVTKVPNGYILRVSYLLDKLKPNYVLKGCSDIPMKLNPYFENRRYLAFGFSTIQKLNDFISKNRLYQKDYVKTDMLCWSLLHFDFSGTTKMTYVHEGYVTISSYYVPSYSDKHHVIYTIQKPRNFKQKV